MDIYLAFEKSHVISPVCDHEGQKCEGDTGGREREANSLLRAKVWELHTVVSVGNQDGFFLTWSLTSEDVFAAFPHQVTSKCWTTIRRLQDLFPIQLGAFTSQQSTRKVHTQPCFESY